MRESIREEPGVPQNSSLVSMDQLDLQFPYIWPGPIPEQGPPSMGGSKCLQGLLPQQSWVDLVQMGDRR